MVEVRCVKLSREQFNAIGKLVSIASRIGGTYEVYGGVNIAEALGHHNTFEGQWYDARTTATLEPASEYEPILDV